MFYKSCSTCRCISAVFVGRKVISASYSFSILKVSSLIVVCLFVFFKIIISKLLIFILFIFFIFGCVGSSPLCEGFLQPRQAGATPHCGARASHCCGLSFVGEHKLQTRRLSSCGSRAQLLHGMWDLPRPGLEPMSPALAGRLSTAAPPGKPSL